MTCHKCKKCCSDCKSKIPKRLSKAMEKLFETFVAVDDGFNDPTRVPGGLTQQEIIDLGYFGEKTTVLAMGPFARPPNDPRPPHSNQPGVFQSFGPEESAQLQLQFEGGILEDPNYPYPDTPEGQLVRPHLWHAKPTITSYLGNNQFTVNAVAFITYNPDDPNGNASPENGGKVVGRVGSIAQYQYKCDKHGCATVPEIVWINFTIAYFDPPFEG